MKAQTEKTICSFSCFEKHESFLPCRDLSVWSVTGPVALVTVDPDESFQSKLSVMSLNHD
jgi:hypothetical protein